MGRVIAVQAIATSEAYTAALNVYSYAKASGSAAEELGRLFVRRNAAAASRTTQ